MMPTSCFLTINCICFPIEMFLSIPSQEVFWIASEVYTFGTIIFIIFGSAVEQHWNRELYVINH